MLLGKDIRTIKKIKIQGVLNKYDVEISSLAGRKIIIGANGVGKSTILKIIDSLFRGDFINLIKYSFNRLELFYTNILGADRKIIINYMDLIVPEKKVKEVLHKNNPTLDTFSRCMLDKFFEEIIANKMLGRFENELAYEDKFSPGIASVVNHYFDENFLFDNCQMKICSDNTTKVICYKEMPFYITEEFELIKNFVDHNESYFYFDLVKSLDIGSKNEQPVIKSNVLTELWKKSKIDGCIDFTKLIHCKADIESFMNQYLSKNDKVLTFNKKKWELGKGYNNVELCFSECRVALSEYVYNENDFNINGYVFTEFEEIVAPIGKIVDNVFEGYLYSLLDNEKTDYYLDSLKEYFGEKEISIYKYCIFPFIPQYSPFKCDIENILNKIKYKELQDARNEILVLEAIKKIYEECKVIMGYIALINDDKFKEFYFGDLSVYRGFICEYLEDKNICMLPSGLMIFDEKYEAYFEQYNIINYVDSLEDEFFIEPEEIIDYTATLSIGMDKNKRYLSELSSGEKKIITLFAIAIFWGGKILADEPELSLSIVWQERLMRDLSIAGEYSSIIVATHSPYICQDEQLKDDIIYML